MQEDGKNYYTTALKFPDSFAKPSKNVGGSDVVRFPASLAFGSVLGNLTRSDVLSIF